MNDDLNNGATRNHINTHLDNIAIDMGYVKGKLESIEVGIDKIGTRVTKAEEGMNDLRVRIAYWGGGLAAVIFIVGILMSAFK